MKKIPLTQNKFVVVDDDDYEKLVRYKWHAQRDNKNGKYSAARKSPRPHSRMILMHRIIMNAQKGQQIDHGNGDSLDNRKENLRFCTHTKNQQNSNPRKNGTSKFKGVHWLNRDRNWVSKIKLNGKQIHLGSYNSEIEAAKAYDKAAVKYFGEFARPNF